MANAIRGPLQIAQILRCLQVNQCFPTLESSRLTSILVQRNSETQRTRRGPQNSQGMGEKTGPRISFQTSAITSASSASLRFDSGYLKLLHVQHTADARVLVLERPNLMSLGQILVFCLLSSVLQSSV